MLVSLTLSSFLLLYLLQLARVVVVVVAVVFAVVVVVSDEAVFNVVSETKRVFQLMKLKE